MWNLSCELQSVGRTNLGRVSHGSGNHCFSELKVKLEVCVSRLRCVTTGAVFAIRKEQSLMMLCSHSLGVQAGSCGDRKLDWISGGFIGDRPPAHLYLCIFSGAKPLWGFQPLSQWNTLKTRLKWEEMPEDVQWGLSQGCSDIQVIWNDWWNCKKCQKDWQLRNICGHVDKSVTPLLILYFCKTCLCKNILKAIWFQWVLVLGKY